MSAIAEDARAPNDVGVALPARTPVSMNVPHTAPAASLDCHDRPPAVSTDPGGPADNARAGPPIDHTSLPPELWLEIFRYATHVPRARTIAPPDPFVPERPANYAWGMNSPIQSMHTKCAVVRVCHAWRMLATELLYEHVVLGSVRRVYLFCRTLVESQASEQKVIAANGLGEAVPAMGHGRWVRHLEVQRWAIQRSSQSTRYWECVVRCVYLCPNLRVFSGIWQTPLPDGLLSALEQYLPSTLQELYWQQDSVLIAAKELPILTTTFLSKFSTLRVLDLRKICVLEAERSLQHVQFPALTLPRVTYLALPTCPLLLRFASKQVLPELCHLILDAAGAPRTVWAHLVNRELTGFLEVHGHKLTTVELLPPVTQSFRPGPIGISAFLSPKTCPRLDTFVFDCREKAICPSSAALAQVSDRDGRESAVRVVAAHSAHGAAGPAAPLLEEAHPRLRRVGIRGTSISRLYPNKPAQAQAHLNAFLGCRAFFPALEVVRTLGFLVDTSTDMFAPDVFIWWTERFERIGVDLQDGEGVVWMLEEEQKAGAPGVEKVIERAVSRPDAGPPDGLNTGLTAPCEQQTTSSTEVKNTA
ncbi:hypothetical protein ONZ51_g4520 [Trametes cubensis]|uniref:F-box domain-containing protein n=1 Tax=Trametes cubensis TaxID=1111947 RepID=A0AAD7TY50_9APHY|nr:hypothetical protein ONZ51_g4520 [Trametes cubensis]